MPAKACKSLTAIKQIRPAAFSVETDGQRSRPFCCLPTVAKERRCLEVQWMVRISEQISVAGHLRRVCITCAWTSGWELHVSRIQAHTKTCFFRSSTEQ
ncbi:hypothetical protein PM082_013816 [Marasmius tenuissimus]|nr:hypothetical protein PM082_013816 [Marasmius tenuissimus]